MLKSFLPTRFEEKEVKCLSNLIYSDIVVSPYAESCEIELNTDCELIYARHTGRLADIFYQVLHYPLKMISCIESYYSYYGADGYEKAVGEYSKIASSFYATFTSAPQWLLYFSYCADNIVDAPIKNVTGVPGIERRLYIESFVSQAIERFRFTRHKNVVAFIESARLFSDDIEPKTYTLLLTPGGIGEDQFKVLYALADEVHTNYGWRVLFYVESDKIEERILSGNIPVDCDIIEPFTIDSNCMILNWEY